MNRNYLAIALMTVSAIGFTACSNNYQTGSGASTGAVPASSSPVIVKAQNKNSTDKDRSGWSYAGNTGPEYWGDSEEASACKIGQEQSPINIQRVTATTTSAPTINYSQAANIRIHDNNHTIVYTPTTPNNTITLDNERFELKQFHYHTPSEHQFGNQNYPAEIHFVHANSAGNLAVIGVMLENGQANDVMRILLNGTQLSSENEVEFTANNVNLAALIPAMPSFYHYAGSLTTPPCSEKVQWYVTKQSLQLANDQLAIMTDLYEGNNRPIQAQGSRTVELLSK